VSVVAVTGAAGGIGRRVLDRLANDAEVERIVVLESGRFDVGGPKVELHRVELSRDDVEPLLEGVDTLLHLAFAVDTEWRQRGSERDNVEGTRRLLVAAGATGVRHIVGLSSAVVYGAWPNNPVPITEDAPLRPNPDFAYAVQRAQVEHLLTEWVQSATGRTVAVLRPCVALGEEGSEWIAQSLAAAAGMRLAEEDPPTQYLHLDDLAAAVDLARTARLDGPYNVAPDGWVAGETVRALAGARPRLRLPDAVASRLARLRWRFQAGPIPPGLLPFTSYSWLIANDRLRATGWRPRRTSEQAYVAGTETRWWTMLTPQRKQELSLGAAGGVLAIVGAVVTVVVRRALRTSRRDARRA
jgi:nucleoside-diphosphate-sugar epimerase